MPAQPTTPQSTKFYIPHTVENYCCFLTSGQDEAATTHLFYTAATAEPTTPFLPLHSLPGKLHKPAYNRLQMMMHAAADAHLWHYYSLTELHTTTNHQRLRYHCSTHRLHIATTRGQFPRLLRQGLHQPPTSIVSNYTLRRAQLINYNFNITLHYTLSNVYVWDYCVLINTQQLLAPLHPASQRQHG